MQGKNICTGLTVGCVGEKPKGEKQGFMGYGEENRVDCGEERRADCVKIVGWSTHLSGHASEKYTGRYTLHLISTVCPYCLTKILSLKTMSWKTRVSMGLAADTSVQAVIRPDELACK